ARRQLHPGRKGLLQSLSSQHQASRRRVHLWRLAMADVVDGRSTAPLSHPLPAPDLRPRRALRLSRLPRHESFEARAPRGLPRDDRGAVLELVSEALAEARLKRRHSVSPASSPSITRRCFVSSAPTKSMKARTRAARRRSEWVSIHNPKSSSG